MRRFSFLFMAASLLLTAACAQAAATGRIIKVLPLFLDRQGRQMLAPSLYERDAYQAFLLAHPKLQAGMLFEIQWKTKGQTTGPLKLRVELRGVANGDLPKLLVMEEKVQRTHWFSRWTEMKLTGKDFKAFGRETAWRVTLWQGDEILAHQQSFLW
jgi:hypothetical protein